jgi:prepilin signal peptidase PulO-like enzyme (type II secretory pathway)
VKTFLEIPFELRLVLVFVVGICAGVLVNWATYSLCWNPRPLSPWSRAHPRDARSSWLDRLPIYGWWRLQRKGKTLGYEFWIRPLIVELLTGLLFVFFYWWEIGEMGLVDPPLPWGIDPGLPLLMALHAQCLAHLLLVTLMFAVTLIDIDEQTIPDELTVPGTILALLLAAVLPASHLPDQVLVGLAPQPTMQVLHAASPNPWPAAFEGSPNGSSLALGIGCILLWCIALLPRPWYGRYGTRRACRYLVATILRASSLPLIAIIALVGSAGVAWVWWLGGESWQGLLSSLIGLVIGGGLIWMIRVIGGWALQREAMGFGDVTLMCMIGAFLGWQPCVLIFFLAPFFGLALGLIRWTVRRESSLPYGPFLCLGTLIVVFRWPIFWERVFDMFLPGWLIPAAAGICLLALVVVLGVWRGIRTVGSRSMGRGGVE